jgi:hypothetical protein
VKRILIALGAVAGVAMCVAPAQGQQGPPANPGNACPPGQTGNNPYCQVPPPNCGKATAKMSLLRATFFRQDATLSILAPITALASGRATIFLQAASTTSSFTLPVDGANRRIRGTRPIKRSQAAFGTGILNISYKGDADTRPQTVRLRAANRQAILTSSRPTITSSGRLRASGTVTNRANGVVRVQLEYVSRTTGETTTLQRNARIQDNGDWSLDSQLTQAIRTQIAGRCGTVHSYVLFTGYLPQRIRGEMRNFEVLPSQ